MIALQLTNAAEMVFSATPATEGRQHTLDFIPGQALWGALAARIYAHPVHRARAFELVHAGVLRVSPGFPLTRAGQPAFPWPQCLQHPKHESERVEDGRKTRRLWNTLDGALVESERKQTEPPKGQFIAADLDLARPARRDRGKAAIQPGGRRAATAQFFQYELLDADASWLAWIDADDPADLEIAALLLDGAVLQLGRSKRREYGGDVTVTVRRDWVPALPRADRGTEVVVWCLSDVALPDCCGGIDLAPEPERFGIPGFHGRLDRVRSLIATRRYAPFNAFLRARDREHAVIEAGSVLVYTDASAPAAGFDKPIGLWRERGLGIVWVNAPVLNTDGKIGALTTSRSAGNAAEAPEPSPKAEADSVLLAVLRARAARVQDATSVTEGVGNLFALLRAQQTDLAEAGEAVPGASQWSRVANVAGAAGQLAELQDGLFNPANGICVGVTNREWQVFYPTLRSLIGAAAQRPADFRRFSDEALCTVLQRAARKMAAAARKDADR
nr:hypothetical protein [uncultured Rhodopila sp.]